MEKIEVDNKDRPIEDIILLKAEIFVNPFDEADEQYNLYCGRGAESAYHILCECEALDHRRQTVYGRPSMSPAEYSAHPAAGLYRLVQGSRVLEWVL
ncbi:hypothetical protein NQ315_017388 [Exocentrus adspersus]|uniref:Uncharacterized protein n=1 Tax=Exocentrus adspersus TaxID=1586481 RepID=A0AAV8VKI1_9CUCU|nr:hypothetical protein NQ315_017388 [Exocentrus adspersus]